MAWNKVAGGSFNYPAYRRRLPDFTKKLYNDLLANGVRCWFAPEDIPIGAKVRQVIYNNIQEFYYLLIILSGNSINSNWVEFEVETAYARESELDRTILIPIRIDDDVKDTTKAWAASIWNIRFTGNFQQWKDDTNYQRMLNRLLKALEDKS